VEWTEGLRWRYTWAWTYISNEWGRNPCRRM